jgi:hypothetical protein
MPGLRPDALLLPLTGLRLPIHCSSENQPIDANRARGVTMTIVCRVLAVAAISLAASLSAQAEEGDKSGAQSAPIPTLHCEFKSVNACSPDGGCKEGKDLAGLPLPIKVTVDFENTVVAAVDDAGYARTDNFDSAANSADQLVVHGIDGPFSWQMAIHNASPAASITFASADSVITGFGTCTNK